MRHDVIIIGGGPGGSTAGALLAQQGWSVLLLEREHFPRFQIGESLLPYNNELFERLGVADKLEAGEFHPKYGAEFRTGDGTIGYTFRFDQNLEPEYHRSFQVERAEFDHLLLRNAAEKGVDVREGTAVTGVDLDDPERVVVRTATGEQFESRFVIDASGHHSIVGNRIGRKQDVDGLKKVAIFGHYRGVPRAEGRDAGNTVIIVIRDAWFWLIPITDDIMSVGLVVDREHLKSCGLSPEELLDRTIERTPWVAERMQSATRVTPIYVRRDFSYRMRSIVGPNYALVGDAAGFLDPIFSTGVFVAMKSADIAARATVERLRTGRMRPLKRYEREVSGAMRRYMQFISNFYRHEFLEIFLQPKPNYKLIPIIVGVLAGNVFQTRGGRFQLALFFSLVKLQRSRGVIAPRIDWETLPAAATV